MRAWATLSPADKFTEQNVFQNYWRSKCLPAVSAAEISYPILSYHIISYHILQLALSPSKSFQRWTVLFSKDCLIAVYSYPLPPFPLLNCHTVSCEFVSYFILSFSILLWTFPYVLFYIHNLFVIPRDELPMDALSITPHSNSPNRNTTTCSLCSAPKAVGGVRVLPSTDREKE